LIGRWNSKFESLQRQRDGKYFGYILNYLRSGGFSHNFALPLDKHILECLYLEARYYNIQGLMELIEETSDNIRIKYQATGSCGRYFTESTIMNAKQAKRLWIEILKGVEKTSAKLLFRASRDGGNNFHKCCDNLGPTVTIIKSNGCIFGAYTPISWASKGAYVINSATFLFSLVGPNDEERTVKISNVSGNHSIHDSATAGPTFGGGHDLYISANYQSTSNYSGLGSSYQLTGGNYGPSGASSYLAGSYNFVVSDYEVYQLTV